MRVCVAGSGRCRGLLDLFIWGVEGAESRGCNVHWKKPIGSHGAVIFFCYARLLPGAACLPPDTAKKILSSNFLGWCRAGRQVLHLRALSVCPVGLLTFSLRRCVGCSGPLEMFYMLFYGCLFIVSRSMSRVQMELRLGQSAAPL